MTLYYKGSWYDLSLLLNACEAMLASNRLCALKISILPLIDLEKVIQIEKLILNP